MRESMADAPVVHVEDNSVEQVAFKLLVAVAAAERKFLQGTKATSGELPTRDWILDAYNDCLKAARGKRI